LRGSSTSINPTINSLDCTAKTSCRLGHVGGPVAFRAIVKHRRRGENTRAMPNKDVVIVILAAGKGTRLKSSRAKVLHSAGGRSLIEHVVRCCTPLKPKRFVTVVGHQAEQVRAAVEKLDSQTVLQQPQNGTGHAMLVAK